MAGEPGVPDSSTYMPPGPRVRGRLRCDRAPHLRVHVRPPPRAPSSRRAPRCRRCRLGAPDELEGEHRQDRDRDVAEAGLLHQPPRVGVAPAPEAPFVLVPESGSASRTAPIVTTARPPGRSTRCISLKALAGRGRTRGVEGGDDAEAGVLPGQGRGVTQDDLGRARGETVGEAFPGHAHLDLRGVEAGDVAHVRRVLAMSTPPTRSRRRARRRQAGGPAPRPCRGRTCPSSTPSAGHRSSPRDRGALPKQRVVERLLRRPIARSPLRGPGSPVARRGPQRPWSRTVRRQPPATHHSRAAAKTMVRSGLISRAAASQHHGGCPDHAREPHNNRGLRRSGRRAWDPGAFAARARKAPKACALPLRYTPTSSCVTRVHSAPR